MKSLEQGHILVTGGAGFIGSALIWALNQRGIENILVTDLLGTGPKYRNLVSLRFDDYLEGDDFLQQLESSPARFQDITHVFHLGANSSTTETDNRHLIENNYAYTKRLATWALEQGTRFVYASSAATYGDGAHGMDDGGELTPLRPLNMYGYSKHLFDLHAQRRGWLGRVVGLKYFNVFGPNEGHKGDMRSVVHKAYGQIAETGRVSLFKSYRPDYPDGGQQRDFLYVKDAVEMTLHLAENPRAAGLYNLGAGVARTWIDLVTPIFETLGKPVEIDFIEMPASLRAKYQYHTCAQLDRLRQSGYSRQITSLEKAVRDYVGNYLVPARQLGDE